MCICVCDYVKDHLVKIYQARANVKACLAARAVCLVHLVCEKTHSDPAVLLQRRHGREARALRVGIHVINAAFFGKKKPKNKTQLQPMLLYLFS